MGEQSKSKVHAPYNFVPFSEKVLLRYAGPEELPRHDQIDPALKSGEIHVTMTADTPCSSQTEKRTFSVPPAVNTPCPAPPSGHGAGEHADPGLRVRPSGGGL